VRHRLDRGKLIGKGGGYNLRKYKRIYKREVRENGDIVRSYFKDPIGDMAKDNRQ
jgi:hypothetical protein